jgi:hypothetical protein
VRVNEEFRMVWHLRNLRIGLLVTALALLAALVVSRLLDAGWDWSTLALLFLGAGAALLFTLLTQPGTTLPGAGVGYDPQDMYVELMARETAHTATDYRPSSGYGDALIAMLPAAIAFVLVVVMA